MNPFGLTIVIDSHGNADDDLLYDDGETIDTIPKTNNYFYAKKNNYFQMYSLILDSLSIYGLNKLLLNITINEQ